MAPMAEKAGISSLSGVILAAGASSRMGRPKQLLPLRGRPLLQRVLDQAIASRLDEIVLVLGHRADEVREALALPEGRRVRAVVNADWARGQSTTLRLALRRASPTAAAAAILLGDQPGVEAALIDRVARAFLDADLPAARPVYSGADGSRVPGHPVLLARRIWSEVDKLGGDEGARALLASRADWLLEVPVEGEPPADIDTWEDYRRAGGAGPTGRG
jgi:molybdenum cofactor cytidylyltransferase